MIRRDESWPCEMVRMGDDFPESAMASPSRTLALCPVCRSFESCAFAGSMPLLQAARANLAVQRKIALALAGAAERMREDDEGS